MKSHETWNGKSLDKIKKKAMVSLAMHWQMILRHTTQSIITHWFRMSSKRNHKEIIKKGCFLGTVCHIAICKQHATPRLLLVSTKHQKELLEKKVQSAFNWMWTMLCVIFRSNHYALPCISLGLCFVWFLGLPMDINVAALSERSPQRDD